MDWKYLLETPFIQVALPIMITFFAAFWNQNKRLDDMRSDFSRRFEAIDRRLERIEAKLDDVTIRVTRLEERTAIIR